MDEDIEEVVMNKIIEAEGQLIAFVETSNAEPNHHPIKNQIDVIQFCIANNQAGGFAEAQTQVVLLAVGRLAGERQLLGRETHDQIIPIDEVVVDDQLLVGHRGDSCFQGANRVGKGCSYH